MQENLDRKSSEEPPVPMKYLAEEDYVMMVSTLLAYTGVLLFSITKHCPQVKGTIIRNFIARGMTFVQSILQLWKSGNIEDCWVLNHALLDRLFHLRHLEARSEFELFERWSFIQQYEAKNASHSDPFSRAKLPQEQLIFTEDQKQRYKKLKAEGVQWKRPKAENLAKSMEMSFLYRYGYDFASRHVHPMADDGDACFERICRIKSPLSPELVVVHNSVLIHVMLIQEGLLASKLRWAGLISDFQQQCLDALDGAPPQYLATFAEIAVTWPANEICAPAQLE